MAETRGTISSVATTAVRAVGQLLWVLLPAISLNFLAWVPANQTFWRARSAGWLIVTILLVLCSAGTVTGVALDIDSGAIGAMVIVGGIGGTVAALNGRRIVFGPHEEPVDPAVQAVLDARARRAEAREIASSDVEMAVELGIGRPDVPSDFDDGGLVDLNNAPADVIARTLDWPPKLAAKLVSERDAMLGYASMAEALALSSISHRWLDRDAERIVVLPYRKAR